MNIKPIIICGALALGTAGVANAAIETCKPAHVVHAAHHVVHHRILSDAAPIASRTEAAPMIAESPPPPPRATAVRYAYGYPPPPPPPVYDDYGAGYAYYPGYAYGYGYGYPYGFRGHYGYGRGYGWGYGRGYGFRGGYGFHRGFHRR